MAKSKELIGLIRAKRAAEAANQAATQAKAPEAAKQADTQAKAQQEYRNNFSTNYSRLTASDIEEEEKMGMKHGGKVSSASKRADGVATKGKTQGKIV